MAVPTRILWSVEQLAAEPTDRLLEIGCGGGVAASLVCAMLASGHLTAIDRSATAIKVARKRNAEHEAAGKAIFMQKSLADLDCGLGLFDKAFAVNVNLFWVDPRRELSVIRDVLAPNGRLFLLYEPPSAEQRHKVEKLCCTNLERNGFSTDRVIEHKGGTSSLLGIVAKSARHRVMF